MTPDPETPKVATGNRREETHYEADADQQVRVAHLAKPDAPLPKHEATVGAGLEPDKPGTPIQDVKVDTAASSVWDGRPPEGRAFEDVPDPGAPQASPLSGAGEPEDGDGPAKPPFPPSELVSKRAGG